MPRCPPWVKESHSRKVFTLRPQRLGGGYGSGPTPNCTISDANSKS
jgi:hypothetical protein